MSSTLPFDFRQSVAYNAAAKRLFHSRARRQLRQLAAALDLAPEDYSLRSNPGGIAVSGEISVHAAHLYVQVCQPATGHDTGILFRTAGGRADFTGGRNHFASLDLLNQPADLARLITGILSPAAVASTPRKTSET